MKLHETKLKRLNTVKGRAVDFLVDAVRLPNGKHAVREYLDHPGAVAVIPFLANDRIVLVQQFRYPVRELTWEIPAGKLSPGETPLSCVKRELAEETGYRAKSIRRLLSFWPTAAFANEVIHIFTAEGLVPGRMNPDDDEFLLTEAWPLTKALRAVQSGRVKDSKTIIALLAYQALRRR